MGFCGGDNDEDCKGQHARCDTCDAINHRGVTPLGARREVGFYWVQQRGAKEPEVARWEHECWWVTGEKRQLLDEDLRVFQRVANHTNAKQ
jgi:hypothetical protein